MIGKTFDKNLLLIFIRYPWTSSSGRFRIVWIDSPTDLGNPELNITLAMPSDNMIINSVNHVLDL